MWVYPKSIADMPQKPGKEAYEYVPCLIVRKGDVLARPWNCEHEVFDDEDQDDFYCEWSEVTAYMDLRPMISAFNPFGSRSAALSDLIAGDADMIAPATKADSDGDGV